MANAAIKHEPAISDIPEPGVTASEKKQKLPAAAGTCRSAVVLWDARAQAAPALHAADE